MKTFRELSMEELFFQRGFTIFSSRLNVFFDHSARFSLCCDRPKSDSVKAERKGWVDFYMCLLCETVSSLWIEMKHISATKMPTTQRREGCSVSINSLKSQIRHIYMEIQTEYQISRELIFPVMCT